MNKIISVNIGGLVFPIDETAYDKLEAYFKALRSQFEGTEGSDEIVNDIELRIAEIFQERRKGENGAILAADIDHMVETMGKPADYDSYLGGSPGSNMDDTFTDETTIEGGKTDLAGQAYAGASSGNTASDGTSHSTADAAELGSSGSTNGGGNSTDGFGNAETAGPKRFFRNPDDQVFGGVCSGFAAYFNIDPLIVRIVFVILFFSGLSLIFYPIFWIIIPEAKTRADKMQMRGEKININTIEKTIRAEFDDLKQRFEDLTGSKKKVSRDDPSSSGTPSNGSPSEDTFASGNGPKGFSNLMGKLFGLVGKIFGIGISIFVFLIIARVLLAVFGGIFSNMIGTNNFALMAGPDISSFLFSNSIQKVLVIIGVTLLVAIPAVVFLYKLLRALLGIKGKSRLSDGVFTLFWIGGLGMVISAGVLVGMEFNEEASFKDHVPIKSQTSTLYVDMINYAGANGNYSYRHSGNGSVNLGDNAYYIKNDSLFIENVELKIVTAQGKNYNLYTVQRSRGKNRSKAKQNARDIKFNIKQNDSIISLPALYTTGKKTWRNQRMSMILEVPVGNKIIIDEKVDHILKHVDRATFIADRDFFNTPLVMSAEGLQLPTP